MSDGQLALNTNLVSPGLFFKDSNGDSVKVGPVHVGTTAPNATPGAGGQAGNSKGEQWLDTSSSRYVFKIWDGTAWRTEDGEFVNVSGDTMTGALGIIAGTAAAPGVFFTGDLNTGIFSPGADQVAVATNGTSRLHISSAGLVGIGTSTPSEILDAYGSIRFGAANVGRIYSTEGTRGSIQISAPHDSTNRAVSYGNNYYIDSSGTWTQASSAIGGSAIELRATSNNYGEIIFRQKQDGDLGGAERIPLVITGAGNVGIGITSPTEGLHTAGPPLFEHNSSAALYIKKTTTGTESRILFSNTADTKAAQMRINWAAQTFGAFEAWVPANASNGQSIAFEAGRDSTIFYTTSTERARIDSSGRLLIGTSSASTTLGALTAKLQVQGTSAFDTGTSTILWEASTNPALLNLVKSRGASVGTHTVVQDNDNLGRIAFGGSDGTDFETAAWIQCAVDGTPGANDMPGRLTFSTTADGASSPTERLRITSAGLVGIGTGAPAEILALRSSSSAIQIDTKRSDTTYGNAEILLGSPRSDTADGSTVAGRGLLSCLGNSTNTTGIVWLQAATASLATQLTDTDLKTKQCGIRLASDGSFEHWSSGSQRLKIDSSGRLLVGTSTALTAFFGTPVNKLAIGGGAAPQVIGCYAANQFGPRLDFIKSRSATVNGQAIVSIGDGFSPLHFHA
jgi:hypothetical protein